MSEDSEPTPEELAIVERVLRKARNKPTILVCNDDDCAAAQHVTAGDRCHVCNGRTTLVSENQARSRQEGCQARLIERTTLLRAPNPSDLRSVDAPRDFPRGTPAPPNPARL